MALDLKRVPKWAWVVAALVAVGVYWYFHTRSTSAATDASATDTTSATPVDTASLGGTPDSGGGLSGDAGATATPDYSQLESDLAQQQSDAFTAFEAQVAALLAAGVQPTPDQTQTTPAPVAANPVPSNPSAPVPLTPAPAPVSAAIAAAGLPDNTYAGLSTTTITTGAAAGGVIYTPTPAAAAAINQSPNALQGIGSDAAQSAGGSVHYYTYKKNVPLGPGQKVKFTAGKGYYAG